MTINAQARRPGCQLEGLPKRVLCSIRKELIAPTNPEERWASDVEREAARIIALEQIRDTVIWLQYIPGVTLPRTDALAASASKS